MNARTASKPKRQDLLERLPPQNLDAEQSLLGSLLLAPSMCDEVALIVKPADFYLPAHQVLFALMTELHDKGKPFGVTLLVNELEKRALLEDAGGTSYLAELADSVPTPTHAAYYAGIVKDKATLRSLVYAGTEIVRDAYDDAGEPREKVARAEQRLMQILESHGARDLEPFMDVLHQALADIERQSNEKSAAGLSTGFADVDALCGGLCESELVIVAARPGMGKTAFATNILEFLSLHTESHVLFVSLEMSDTSLTNRMLHSLARVGSRRGNNRRLDQTENQKLIEASNRLSKASGRVWIDDQAGRTVTEIAAQARRLKRKPGLDLLIVDYLQRIHAENSRDIREQQVAMMSRRLKDLAQELRIPVLCLSQLNRETERADGKNASRRPKLSHLRDSGAIEQDADVVLFVHREDYYRIDPQTYDHKAEIIVAKNRNGETGVASLEWSPVWTRFEGQNAMF